MSKKEWKQWQQVYNQLVQDHSDAGHKHARRIEEEIVENALFYLKEKANYGIYPAKSYMVGIIYATMIHRVYKEDFYDVLDDPDLLCGQDDFFVPYSKDKENYDKIIARLDSMPNWLEMGWAPTTVGYFYLECTEEGISKVNENSMTG